jgi:hypothetical protein
MPLYLSNQAHRSPGYEADDGFYVGSCSDIFQAKKYRRTIANGCYLYK